MTEDFWYDPLWLNSVGVSVLISMELDPWKQVRNSLQYTFASLWLGNNAIKTCSSFFEGSCPDLGWLCTQQYWHKKKKLSWVHVTLYWVLNKHIKNKQNLTHQNKNKQNQTKKNKTNPCPEFRRISPHVVHSILALLKCLQHVTDVIDWGYRHQWEFSTYKCLH